MDNKVLIRRAERALKLTPDHPQQHIPYLQTIITELTAALKQADNIQSRILDCR